MDSEQSLITPSERVQTRTSFGHRRNVDTGVTSDHDSDDCVPKELKKKRNARRKSPSRPRKAKSPKKITTTGETVHDDLPSPLVGCTERRKLPNGSKPDYSLAPRLPSTQSTIWQTQSTDPTPQRTSTPSLFLTQQSENPPSLPASEVTTAAELSDSERQITPPLRNVGLLESSKPKSPPSLGKSILDPARKKRSLPASPSRNVHGSPPIATRRITNSSKSIYLIICIARE